MSYASHIAVLLCLAFTVACSGEQGFGGFSGSTASKKASDHNADDKQATKSSQTANNTSSKDQSPSVPGSTPVGTKPAAGVDLNGIPHPDQSSRSNGQVTDTFNLNKKIGQQDIVWVIDNSSSMSNEISYVVQNFDRFLNTMKDRTDIKVALISGETKPPATYGVDLPASVAGVNIQKFSYEITSINALGVLAASSCALATTVVTKANFGGVVLDQICGVTVPPRKVATVFHNEILASARGVLSGGFYRTSANKIFVIVSDDEAQLVDSGIFTQAMSHAGIGPYKVFAFVATDASTCSVSHVGKSYLNLAAATGGQAFDICATDWGSTFEDIGRRIVAAARTRFAVSDASLKAITQVAIDGAVIPAGSYTFQGGVLTFKDGVVPPQAAELRVTYQVE